MQVNVVDWRRMLELASEAVQIMEAYPNPGFITREEYPRDYGAALDMVANANAFGRNVLDCRESVAVIRLQLTALVGVTFIVCLFVAGCIDWIEAVARVLTKFVAVRLQTARESLPRAHRRQG
jgi:hypothetical protein